MSTTSARKYPQDSLTPRPEHHFTFGLWTVGNRGRDPFGHEVRPPLDPVDAVRHLAELGAYGVNFHDNDLVPADATPGDRERIVKRFRLALAKTFDAVELGVERGARVSVLWGGREGWGAAAAKPVAAALDRYKEAL